jgi:hypothetical protein
LKQRIETQKVPPSPVEPPAPAAPVQENAPAAVAVSLSVSEEDQSKESTARQLLELTRWLDSISRRKSDVQ